MAVYAGLVSNSASRSCANVRLSGDGCRRGRRTVCAGERGAAVRSYRRGPTAHLCKRVGVERRSRPAALAAGRTAGPLLDAVRGRVPGRALPVLPEQSRLHPALRTRPLVCHRPEMVPEGGTCGEYPASHVRLARVLEVPRAITSGGSRGLTPPLVRASCATFVLASGV